MQSSSAELRVDPNSKQYYGTEPVVSEVKSEIELIKLLNWYNYCFTPEDGVEWILTWMRTNNYSPEEVRTIKNCKPWRVGLVAMSLARIMNNGTKVLEKNPEFIRARIKEALASVEPRKDNVVQLVAADTAQDKLNRLIGDLDEQVDLFLKTFSSKFDFSAFFKENEIKAYQAQKVIDYYVRLNSEIAAALMGSDEQVSEAYRIFSKKELVAYSGFVKSIIDAASDHVEVKKATRKPRVAKKVDVKKVVSAIQYQKEAPEWKITSIDPASIIGAKELWIFNTRYRTFGIYYSDEGFGFRGATMLLNWRKDSFSKTLRHPDTDLARIMGSSKLQAKKVLASLSTKPAAMNGALNNNIVLLKVFR